MENVWLNAERSHLCIRHLASSGIARRVELALHGQSSFSRGRGDQLEDDRVADQRLAAPVLADPGKEAMLDLVPFAGARWPRDRP